MLLSSKDFAEVSSEGETTWEPIYFNSCFHSRLKENRPRHVTSFCFFASCPVLQEMTWQILGKVMLTFHGSKKKYSSIM